MQQTVKLLKPLDQVGSEAGDIAVATFNGADFSAGRYANGVSAQSNAASQPVYPSSAFHPLLVS
jgi:hypothetical protein